MKVCNIKYILIFPIILSCSNIFTDDDLYSKDGITIKIDDWYQQANGDLYINFTLKNDSGYNYDSITVGIKSNYSSGYFIAYGTIHNIIPDLEYSGQAKTTNAKGEYITSVSVFNFTAIR